MVVSVNPVEDMANANLHVMRFLGLDLEDDVRDSFRYCPVSGHVDESTGGMICWNESTGKYRHTR
ncbi:MAG: hypothetical protein MRJ52_01545 [Nitrosomonas sp.]|nr:hypothetical protein [Nitrosomonas sp.]